MSETKIKVPEGMRRAAEDAVVRDLPGSNYCGIVNVGLEAALRWLSENPIVPTMEQATEMSDSGHPCVLDGVWYATEWQRRMFLAPEPEVPEALDGMLVKSLAGFDVNDINWRIQEAYNRGKAAK